MAQNNEIKQKDSWLSRAYWENVNGRIGLAKEVYEILEETKPTSDMERGEGMPLVNWPIMKRVLKGRMVDPMISYHWIYSTCTILPL